MKTKEEIEQLAEEFLTFHQDGSKVYHIKIREAIEFAYTQCQEDMQKDVEYWQGEFEHWFKQAMDMSNKYNELLNKQDNEN